MYIVNLKRAMSKLTHSENRIATYLTDNYHDIKGLTSYDLAKKANVGQSTIIRFSQKLGYKSFSDMYEDLLNNNYEFDDVTVNTKEDTTVTNEKLYRGYTESLKEVLKFNPEEVFDQIVDKLFNADKIYCFGAQSTNALAKIFSNRLMEIGIDSVNSDHLFEGISRIRTMKEHDVAFFISTSGESAITLKLARFAKEKGVTVISITGLQDSTLKELSDIVLCCTESIIYTNIKWITNRSSQLFLIDSLFLNLWKRNSEAYNQKINEIDDFTRSDFGGYQLLPDDKENE